MSKETIKCKCGGTMHHSDDMENPFAGTDDRRPFYQCEDCGEIYDTEVPTQAQEAEFRAAVDSLGLTY